MADAVTSQTLQDADDFVIMRFTSVSDGTGEAAVVKVDVSALEVSGRNGAACTEVAIQEIEYTTQRRGWENWRSHYRPHVWR